MNKYLLGIIIFLILISTNKLSYVLGCNINKILDNVYLTEFFTIIFIYYAVKIFGDQNTKSHLYHSLSLYVLLKFFSKMNRIFTIIALLIMLFILFEDMLKDKNELLKDENTKDNYLINEGEKLLIIVVIIGFFYNLRGKYKEYGSKFSLLKYFFSKKCNNIIYT